MRRLFRAVLFLLPGLMAALPAVAAETELSIAELGGKLAERYKERQPTRWGEHLPGVVRSVGGLSAGDGQPEDESAPRTLALTLDACNGRTDTRIIELLREHTIPATLFVTNRWLSRNRELAETLAADPLFAFACHGKHHKPASVNGRQAYGIHGTRNIPALVEEVEENARAVTSATGVRPAWYRSGTAHYDDVALDVIRDLGFSVAGYLVSADQGATLPARDIARRLLAAPDKAIVICHLNHPESGAFQGLALALPPLLEQGVRFVLLDEVPDERLREKKTSLFGEASNEVSGEEHGR